MVTGAQQNLHAWILFCRLRRVCRRDWSDLFCWWRRVDGTAWTRANSRANTRLFRLSAFPQIAYNSKRGRLRRLPPRSRGNSGVALAQRIVVMNGVLQKLSLTGCAVLLAGCISTRDTRLPTLGYRDPRAEKASYSYLNPLPDPSVGTWFEQPRGFEFQRAQPRRSQDARAITDEITHGGGAISTPAASRYPQSVTP